MAKDESGDRYVDLPEGFPENLGSIIEQIPLSEPTHDGAAAVVDQMEEGKCATCGVELGENTLAVLSTTGLVMLFCSGACMTDMQVVGWLEETHDDIVTRVDFRGGRGDSIEEG